MNLAPIALGFVRNSNLAWARSGWTLELATNLLYVSSDEESEGLFG